MWFGFSFCLDSSLDLCSGVLASTCCLNFPVFNRNASALSLLHILSIALIFKSFLLLFCRPAVSAQDLKSTSLCILGHRLCFLINTALLIQELSELSPAGLFTDYRDLNAGLLEANSNMISVMGFSGWLNMLSR